MKTNAVSSFAPRALIVTGALFATAILASAQTPHLPLPNPNKPEAANPKPDTAADDVNAMLNRGDRSFVQKAAKANTEEVAISRIATERAVRSEVRSLAQELLTLHQALDTSLARLATSKGVALEPATEDAAKKWSDKRPSDFDEDYVKEMVSAHRRAVSLFEDAARDAKDPEVAAFAREQLATLNEHLRKAEQIKKVVD